MFTCFLNKGDELRAATSSDGKSWVETKPMTLAWPADLTLGVEAVNSNSEPFQVTFEEFVVKPGAAK